MSLSIAIGSKYKCNVCNTAILIIGSRQSPLIEVDKCPKKGCSGVLKPTRLGWI